MKLPLVPWLGVLSLGLLSAIARAEVHYTWLGTTGVVIEDGPDVVLVDPVVTRPGPMALLLDRPVSSDRAAVDEVIEQLGLRRALAVLVTHSHFDHAMDAAWFAGRLGATLMGTASTLNLGRGVGLPEAQLREIHPDDELSLGAIGVRVLEAVHGPVFGRVPYPGQIEAPLVQPAPVSAYKMGGSLSFHVRSSQGDFLFHPAANAAPAVPLDGYQVPVVFQGLATRASDEHVFDAVLSVVGARKVIPLHFDNFLAEIRHEPRPFLPVQTRSFVRYASAQGLEVEMPAYLRRVPVFGP